MKTFRALDGRRVTERMSEEQIVERELLKIATCVMPVLMIVVFALAAGIH